MRSREALERATGRRVLGYRLAQQWLRPADFWVLDVLARAGYEYDSSLRMVFRTYAREPWRQFPHRTTIDGRTFLEVPLSSMRVLGLDVPIAGGNYFRQFPHSLVKRAVAHWDRSYDDPFVMYFHTWELDPDQPRINGVPFRQQIRQYRNLRKMPAIVRYYLERYRFTSVADYFELGTQEPEGAVGTAAPRQRPRIGGGSERNPGAARADRGLGRRALLQRAGVAPLSRQHPPERRRQAGRPVRLPLRLRGRLQHRSAPGRPCTPSSAAIRATHSCGTSAIAASPRRSRPGSARPPTDVVCSMDCDCTYDPHELGSMIPLLADDVDVVTASPYHPLGTVRNVPRWRLFLSKSLSRLYRVVLRQKLYTYTSCFRVYRRAVRRGDHGGARRLLRRRRDAGPARPGRGGASSSIPPRSRCGCSGGRR